MDIRMRSKSFISFSIEMKLEITLCYKQISNNMFVDFPYFICKMSQEWLLKYLLTFKFCKSLKVEHIMW
jgi:hypothetical protein